MCTVFAESEVVSMLGRGYDRAKIARGIHFSIISRAAAMLRKIGIEKDIAFVGGVAKNIAILTLLSETLQTEIKTSENPQITGALGCALHQNRQS